MDDQTPYYYGKTIRNLVIKYLIYRQLQLYISTTHWDPEPFQTTGLRFLWDVYLLGILLSLLLDIIADLLLHLNANLFKIPIIPIMNLPYISTSVRDFWSVFVPVLIVMGYGKQVSLGKPIPLVPTMLASMCAFTASALMHEWILFIVLDKPSCYEQLFFFMLHGLICIAEVAALKIANRNGIRFEKVPWIIKVLYANLVMIATGPLFMNPFLRERAWEIVNIPLIF
ncbi:hypothetical protein HDV01_003577 [Terramyces sp. JEL0728]|nr:hypothetical protein HDV01_003577 [Terramyces sp. JEL0728]